MPLSSGWPLYQGV